MPQADLRFDPKHLPSGSMTLGMPGPRLFQKTVAPLQNLILHAVMHAVRRQQIQGRMQMFVIVPYKTVFIAVEVNKCSASIRNDKVTLLRAFGSTEGR